MLGFLSSTDYNDTSAKLEDLNLMFPYLEHLLKVGYEDVGLEDEYFSDDEEEVPGSIITMWNTVAKKDHWHKLKEIPYGRKQLGYYGLGAYAHYQTFESVDGYYSYMGSLMDDGPTRFHEKASFCDNVVNKLQDYSKLKHLKFDMDPRCFSMDLKSLDYVIDKSASAVTSLPLEQQDYHETEKTYSYPSGLIRVTNAEGYVDPQPKIKVLKNDLDLVFTGAVASYFIRKFPSLDELVMPNFLWNQQLLTKGGLDAYCQHVVKTVKHYHIRSRSRHCDESLSWCSYETNQLW